MPFIGNQPAEAYSSFQKQDFTTSATTSYTLDHPVSNQNEIALFINFVRQEPTAAYTASGTTLTLTSATASTDDMYCVYLGKAVQTVNPPSGSVGSSQVAASIITGQTALTSEPSSTDELLISDAGTLKRIDYSLISNRPAFEAHLSANQSLTDNTKAKIEFDTEVFDTDGCYDNSTNYRFTPTVAGKYLITVQVNYDSNAASNLANTFTYIHKNTSIYKAVNVAPNDNFQGTGFTSLSAIIDMNGSSDYVEAYVKVDDTSGNPDLEAETGDYTKATSFSGYKLIGV